MNVQIASMRIFIVGAGKGCQVLLEYLLPFSWIQIVGVADINLSAPTMEIARRAGIPTFVTDPIETLKTLDTDVVFELTNNKEITAGLVAIPNRKFDVATGDAIRLFINTINESNERNTLLKKHMEISLMIAQSKTVAHIFDTIVTGGMEMTNMSVGSLALFDQEKEEFAIVSQKGLPSELLQGGGRYPIRSGGLTQFVLSKNKPTIISDLKNDGLINAGLIDVASLLQLEIRSLIAIPLVSEWELLGILYFDDVIARTYSDDIVDRLNQFATEAMVAIQKHKALAKIKQLSLRDPLTGLFNRSQLEIQLKEAIIGASSDKHPLALMICDLDQFKDINEKFGHQYGDQVLKIFSDCIVSAMAKEDCEEREALLFRSGVDEVTVLILNADQDKIIRKASKIRTAVQDGSKTAVFPLDVSIGAAMYPTESQTQDQLLTLANQSLLIAKKSDQKMCIGSVDTLNYSSRIRTIFEPIVDLDNNHIIGFEALSRDAQGKLSIIDLFKQYAALGELAEVKNACFTSQIELAESMNLSRVFLNVDSAMLSHCGWIQKPPQMEVVLEISESESLEDFEAYLKIAKKWKEKGFKFAIDDFGAGFLSLPFLSKLNPDYIKVDRSVMLQAVSSLSFKGFLKNIVGALQKDPGIFIIAEGIETEKELQVSRDVGIPFIQGFLLKDRGYPNLAGCGNNALGTV